MQFIGAATFGVILYKTYCYTPVAVGPNSPPTGTVCDWLVYKIRQRV